MWAKGSNDFSTLIRRGCCRSNSCVSECLCCISAKKHFVLSCSPSLTRPTIALHSCAWQKPSPHSLLACAAPLKRLVSSNARESCDSWLKKFWSVKIQSPFVTASRFLRVRLKTAARSQKSQIHFCVRGVSSTFFRNLYPNEVDRMLERARQNTRCGKYSFIEYARFADGTPVQRST